MMQPRAAGRHEARPARVAELAASVADLAAKAGPVDARRPLEVLHPKQA